MYDQLQHRDGRPRCCFHPGELLVGVCALCLRERLLVLVSKQGDAPLPRNTSRHRSVKPKDIPVPKFLALSSFLHRPGPRRRRREFHDSDQQLEDSFSSLEDYISVQFDDGRASWGRKTAASSHKKGNLPADGERGVIGGKSVVEHGGALRWRKKVGHIFQVLRWKRPSKAASCHTAAEMGKEEVNDEHEQAVEDHRHRRVAGGRLTGAAASNL